MVELEDRYITMQDVCSYLGISRDTVLRWVKNKKMPAYKIEAKWLFKVSEIDDWIKEIGVVENGCGNA